MKQYIFLDQQCDNFLVVNASNEDVARRIVDKNEFKHRYVHEMRNSEGIVLNVTHLGVDGNRIRI